MMQTSEAYTCSVFAFHNEGLDGIQSSYRATVAESIRQHLAGSAMHLRGMDSLHQSPLGVLFRGRMSDIDA